MVEHAIVLPFFLLLILASVEVLRIMYNHICLQYALTEASRFALAQENGATTTQIRDAMEARLTSLGIPFTAAFDTFTVCPAGGTCTAGAITPGAPEQMIVYSLTRRMNFLGFRTNVTSLNVTATVFARNEPAL